MVVWFSPLSKIAAAANESQVNCQNRGCEKKQMLEKAKLDIKQEKDDASAISTDIAASEAVSTVLDEFHMEADDKIHPSEEENS